jgi:hypothetical protein
MRQQILKTAAECFHVVKGAVVISFSFFDCFLESENLLQLVAWVCKPRFINLLEEKRHIEDLDFRIESFRKLPFLFEA